MNQKISIIILGIFVSIMTLFSQNTGSQNDEKVMEEIDSLFNISLKAAEDLDINRLSVNVNDQYKTGFITNGLYYLTFDTLIKDFENNSRRIDGQNIHINEKKISLLSKDVAVVTVNGSAESFLSDGTSFSSGFNWTLIYKKTNGKWMIVHTHQSRGRL